MVKEAAAFRDHLKKAEKDLRTLAAAAEVRRAAPAP